MAEGYKIEEKTESELGGGGEKNCAMTCIMKSTLLHRNPQDAYTLVYMHIISSYDKFK